MKEIEIIERYRVYFGYPTLKEFVETSRKLKTEEWTYYITRMKMGFEENELAYAVWCDHVFEEQKISYHPSFYAAEDLILEKIRTRDTF